MVLLLSQTLVLLLDSLTLTPPTTTSQTLSCAGESDPLYLFLDRPKVKEARNAAGRLNCSGVVVVEFCFQKYFCLSSVAQLVSNLAVFVCVSVSLSNYVCVCVGVSVLVCLCVCVGVFVFVCLCTV